MAKAVAPNVGEVLELHKATKLRYDESGIDGIWAYDEKLYELDFRNELLLPDEFAKEGVVPPTARDLVDACVDHTDISNIRVWCNRKGEGLASEEEGELLRKFALGILYRNNVEAGIAPLRVALKHYYMHGQAVIKTIWDADRWADRPERNADETEAAYASRIDEWRSENHDSIPIVMQAVHPRSVMLDPFNDGQGFVFETRKELCYNVKQKYPNWKNYENRKVSEEVEHISFWTPQYRCELYDNEPIFTKNKGVLRHTYGFSPYVSIDSGLGNMSGDADMDKRYVGVLRYVRDILISEARDYSIGDIILKKTAFPWGYIKGKNAKSVTKVFQKFGEYNPLPDGIDIVDMSPKTPPDALLTWLGVATQYLGGHAAPNSVRGMGESGVRSSVDRRLMISEASARYQYTNEAFKNGVAKVLSNCARIMKNVVPGDISVWARTPTDEFDIVIKKDKMKEPFTFYVEFSPIGEEDEYRRHDDLERMYKSGLVTKNWARKQMSNIDPIAMAKEEEVERMMNDPLVLQITGQAMASKLQAAMQTRDAATALKSGAPQPMMGVPPPGVSGQQAPGGRMSPITPATAPPGSAQEMQNNMANMRSKVPMSSTQGQSGGGSH